MYVTCRLGDTFLGETSILHVSRTRNLYAADKSLEISRDLDER